MSKAEEAAKAYKESLPKRGYVISEACFLNGVKWVIEQAKNFKDEFKGNRDYNQASIDVQQRFYKYLESLKE